MRKVIERSSIFSNIPDPSLPFLSESDTAAAAVVVGRLVNERCAWEVISE